MLPAKEQRSRQTFEMVLPLTYGLDSLISMHGRGRTIAISSTEIYFTTELPISPVIRWILSSRGPFY